MKEKTIHNNKPQSSCFLTITPYTDLAPLCFPGRTRKPQPFEGESGYRSQGPSNKENLQKLAKENCSLEILT